MIYETLPFAVQLTADRKYVNIRVPVDYLPQELRRNPSSLNVRLQPETRRPANPHRWIPAFLLALSSRAA